VVSIALHTLEMPGFIRRTNSDAAMGKIENNDVSGLDIAAWLLLGLC
jgi:hypothetical protein